MQSKKTVRTSDRRTFRRCFRKWDQMASLRKNLKVKGVENVHFWFGSGIHYALEDYHGWNHYGDPRKAFYAYYHAFAQKELPENAEAYYGLGLSMLDYYLTWLPRKNEFTGFETVWMDDNYNIVAPDDGVSPSGVLARPGVEIQFNIPLDLWTNGHQGVQTYPGEALTSDEWTQIYYHGTIDRIVKDKLGRYWLLDYKTAKGADTNKLETDDQIDAYLWAARKLFPFPVYGFIYLQLTKDRVMEPRRLQNGEFSVDKRQKTTYHCAREVFLREYGDINSVPAKLINFLNDLAAADTPEGDRFIRWDFVKRTPEQLDATETKIYQEIKLMLNPYFECFPNPTRDCAWDCPLRDLCLAMDKGETAVCEEILALNWEPQPRKEDNQGEPWERRIKDPKYGLTPEALKDLDVIQLLKDEYLLNLELPSDPVAQAFQFYYEG